MCPWQCVAGAAWRAQGQESRIAATQPLLRAGRPPAAACALRAPLQVRRIGQHRKLLMLKYRKE